MLNERLNFKFPVAAIELAGEIPRDAKIRQKWLEQTAAELESRLRKAKSGRPERNCYVDHDYAITRISPQIYSSFEVDLDNEVFHGLSISLLISTKRNNEIVGL